jgi:hypothetical protein
MIETSPIIEASKLLSGGNFTDVKPCVLWRVVLGRINAPFGAGILVCVVTTDSICDSKWLGFKTDS